jgi:hypothetical protein
MEETQTVTDFKLSANTLNGVVTQLGKQPYNEVFLILNTIHEELKAQGSQGLSFVPKDQKPEVTPEVVE